MARNGFLTLEFMCVDVLKGQSESQHQGQPVAITRCLSFRHLNSRAEIDWVPWPELPQRD